MTYSTYQLVLIRIIAHIISCALASEYSNMYTCASVTRPILLYFWGPNRSEKTLISAILKIPR